MTDRKIPAGWRWVRFGDVVREVRAATRDPEADGLSRVVGLEHLDSESLSLRRWNELADLPDGSSFTRVFHPGQLLFGKRRAYQRKVAVADFSGICSSDILVFEPSTDELLSGFLPYIVQSSGFFDHALGTSAGSLSPRTKWQELAKYEFALPPPNEQQAITEVLASFDELRMRLADGSIEARRVRDALLGCPDLHLSEKSLGEILVACDYGISIVGQDSGDIPMLRMNNLDGSELVLDDLRWVSAAAVRPTDFVEPGDILFNRTNSVELVGKVALVPPGLEPMVFASYLIRLRVNPEMADPAFIAAFLQSSTGQSRIGQYMTRGVSQANVNSSNLKKVVVPVPPLEVQERLVRNWHAVRGVQAALEHHAAQTVWTASATREQLLGGHLSR
jgi:type I restriction enzyme S subunit